MRLLIVNLFFDIGGVETLLARLIPLLKNKGVDVTLLIIKNRIDPELIHSVSPFCKVIFLKDAFPFTKKSLERFFGPDFDVVFFTITWSVIFGSWLLGRANYHRAAAVFGVYQTEIFCEETLSDFYYQKLVRRLIAERIPPSSIIFGNTAGRDAHASGLGMDLSASPVIRLLVDVDKYHYKNRSLFIRRKMVSIGRIVDFKTYNFTMLSVVKTLIDRGHAVEWHVYGDGPQLGEFERAIKSLDLTKYVFAHGPMPYSEFEAVLDEAFVFIGSGTSLIEAAACGVPALTTIEYSKSPDSYGFICDIDGFNLIEPGLDRTVYSIEEKIEKLLGCSSDEYLEIQKRCRIKANEYSGDNVVSDYVAVFDVAKTTGAGIEVSNWNMVSSVFNAIFRKILGAVRSKRH